jgi:AcrR family transcriptional regulator
MEEEWRMPSRKTKFPKTRLSPEDWEAAALDALTESGLAGVAIEPLARRLGVTKGSFYWHFADREALLVAALAHWEVSHTESVIDALKGVSDARDRLVRLIGRGFAGGRSDRIHLALANAGHPIVRTTLERVTHRRLGYLEQCYVELGQARREARRSALVAYAAYVGLVHLRVEAPNELPAREALTPYVEHFISKLVPSTRAATIATAEREASAMGARSGLVESDWQS